MRGRARVRTQNGVARPDTYGQPRWRLARISFKRSDVLTFNHCRRKMSSRGHHLRRHGDENLEEKAHYLPFLRSERYADLWIDRYYRLPFKRRLFPREITRRFRENRPSSRHRLRQQFVSRIIENCDDLGERRWFDLSIDIRADCPLFPRSGKAEVTEHLHDGRRDNFEIRSELMISGLICTIHRYHYAMRYTGVVEPESRKRFDDRHGKNCSIP